MKYNARFEVDLGGDFVYLEKLDLIRDVTIGSLVPNEFVPIAFCAGDIHTINLFRFEEGEFLQEDLIELAKYVDRCNKEKEQ